ncbi:DUF2971 domain-containing protein [Glaciimonas sp. CA11.2]|uniref:DUF2971 domain-containing protein n=1 Tax=Glaciimonas sp. CA11.2 TaxID=3048601 RepID=UPI002AB56065|nr:DUF2971 domain-containing protein [Glaciimonas sp. CA11.2]MDY7545075.1 DUF2971 domain-containing protein [Glaciimonas sp. CA11.2]
MILYKYMPTDRFFNNFKLRFTPANDLNDPRELVPEIRLRNAHDYMSDITNRNFTSAYFKLLFEHPEFSVEEAFARCVAAAKQIEGNFDPVAKAQEIFDRFMRVTNTHVGVLSLTESPDNELMWAHYAASNSGFAIGFDSENPFFQPQPGEPKTCGELMNVIYSDTRPVVFVDPGKLEIPKEIFFTKTTKWSYEREWRMIKYLDPAHEVALPEGKIIHLFEVPTNALVEVIFGTKATLDTITEIRKKLLLLQPNVSFKRMKFEYSKGVVIEDI